PRALAGPAGNPRSAATDANHHRSGNRGPHGGLSGFHSGVLRLVRSDGTKRNSRKGLGGDRWCCRRSSSTRSISHLVSGDSIRGGACPAAWAKVPFLEGLRNTWKIFHLTSRRTWDGGRKQGTTSRRRRHSSTDQENL